MKRGRMRGGGFKKKKGGGVGGRENIYNQPAGMIGFESNTFSKTNLLKFWTSTVD